MRPRDSHAIRVVETSPTLSPPGDTRCVYDALGNSVCRFTPRGEGRSLSIVSHLTIERFPTPLARLQIADPRTAMPIFYASADRTVLTPFIDPVSEDVEGALLDWLRGQLGGPQEPPMEFLMRLNRAIHDGFEFRPRPGRSPGAQEPSRTVRMGSGACRNFAWPMAEALRRLGYAARFVTGYLYSPAHSGIRGAGATHAWCEVFLPELGWTEFDPTNALVESPDLIPVTVTRTPAEAAPISGAIYGDAGYIQLQVHVDVRLLDTLPAAA